MKRLSDCGFIQSITANYLIVGLQKSYAKATILLRSRFVQVREICRKKAEINRVVFPNVVCRKKYMKCILRHIYFSNCC